MKNSILGKARWLREVALATSKNNGARVAREWLKYAAMFVMLLTLGSGNAWGATVTCTFESVAGKSFPYNDAWTLTAGTESNHHHGGSKCVMLNSASFVLTTANKINGTVTNVTYYAGRLSKNSTKTNVYIETSINGSTWTKQNTFNIATAGRVDQNESNWTEVSQNVNVANCYVRISRIGGGTSTAERVIDDVTITYTPAGKTDPDASFSDGTYTIGGSALDLSTLWTSESDGAVTYTVTSAGGTGASISTASFTATTAGSCTVKASQAATASYNAIEKSATITVQNPTCATPTFSPAAGTYTEAQTVSISCATGGATIYYTTNGSDPTTSSSVYSSPLTVSSTQTIKAIAAASGYSNSAIGSATYTIRAGTTFTLLTNASTLKAGDKLIILSTDGNYALAASDGSSTSNRGQTAKTYNYDIDGTNVYVYNDDGDYKDVDILTLGGTSSGWTLATSESSGYYLYHTDASSNTLKIGNSVGDGYYWTIALNGSYEATINNTYRTTYNIKKNSSSDIFSAYTSAQTAIKIYRYENTSPTVEVGTPSGTSFSYVYGNGPSSTQTFTISGSNLTGNVVINAPSNYKIKKGSDSWSSSITLTPSSGTIASTTISIQLVAGLDAGSYNGNITFTNNDGLTISPIALTGTVSKANLNPSFGEATYTIVRDVSTSTTFTLTGVPSDYTGTITYSRTNTPTASARLAIDGTNRIFTAANYSGRWTVTASFAEDGNYNAKTSGVTCVVNAVTRDTYVDNVNGQSVTEEQRTDNGVDPYVSPALSDVVPGSACQGTKVHLIGWASQAFVTKVGNGTLTGADSDYTAENGFYAVGTTLPAASATTYYAVYGEEE